MNEPILLGEAVLLVAKIGGYLDRTNDPPPGHQILWQGYHEFQYIHCWRTGADVCLVFVGNRQT